MAQIFISHVHEEKQVAEAVLRFLQGFELKAFLSSDHWQIRAGERWFDRITAELAEAKVVILLLSERSVSRPWINFEAGWAWATKKATIPTCFGGLTKVKCHAHTRTYKAWTYETTTTISLRTAIRTFMWIR